MAVSESASINSLTIKSRLEKSSSVKLGPLGKTERVGVEETMDALSGIMAIVKWESWAASGPGTVGEDRPAQVFSNMVEDLENPGKAGMRESEVRRVNSAAVPVMPPPVPFIVSLSIGGPRIYSCSLIPKCLLGHSFGHLS